MCGEALEQKMGTVAAQFPYRTNAQKGGMIMGWAKKRKREQQRQRGKKRRRAILAESQLGTIRKHEMPELDRVEASERTRARLPLGRVSSFDNGIVFSLFCGGEKGHKGRGENGRPVFACVLLPLPPYVSVHVAMKKCNRNALMRCEGKTLSLSLCF